MYKHNSNEIRTRMLRGCTPYPIVIDMKRMFYFNSCCVNFEYFSTHKMLSTMFAALFFACPDEPGNLVFDTTSPMSDIWTIVFIYCMDMRHNYLLIL